METAERIHALVIDDDPFVLELMRDMLLAAGAWAVTARSNARAGLDALAQAPDLLICDLSMPDMDGIEFLGAAAQAGYRGGVLLLSGMNAGLLQAAHGLALAQGLRVIGAYRKPMALADLRTALRAVRG